jgi:hypothetical protein
VSAFTATTSTAFLDDSLFLLRVTRDEGWFVVQDVCVGGCYGYGRTLAAALADYAEHVQEFIACLEGQKLSPALELELARYKRAVSVAGETP